MRKPYFRKYDYEVVAFQQKILYLRDVENMLWRDIARQLYKHHSTLIYHYKKGKERKLSPATDTKEISIQVEVKVKPVPNNEKYAHLIEENTRLGDCYDEYVKKSDNLTKRMAAFTRTIRREMAVNRFSL